MQTFFPQESDGVSHHQWKSVWVCIPVSQPEHKHRAPNLSTSYTNPITHDAASTQQYTLEDEPLSIELVIVSTAIIVCLYYTVAVEADSLQVHSHSTVVI